MIHLPRANELMMTTGPDNGSLLDWLQAINWTYDDF